MNINQIVKTAQETVAAIEDKNLYPVPNNASASVAKLVYDAGVEAFREAAVRKLRVGGFNMQACSVLDLKVD